MKSLGKVFDCSLRDAASTQATNQELEICLTTVDKSGLPGKFKAWIYNHGILPQILLANEVPIIEVRTGRKWRAAEAVDVAESRPRQRVLVGTVAQGRASLGSHRTPSLRQGASGREEVADPWGGASRSGAEASQPDGENAAAGGLNGMGASCRAQGHIDRGVEPHQNPIR